MILLCDEARNGNVISFVQLDSAQYSVELLLQLIGRPLYLFLSGSNLLT